MGRKAKFVGELESISHTVDEDVGRVITLLRDTQGKNAHENQGNTIQARDTKTLTEKAHANSVDTGMTLANTGHESPLAQSPVSDRTILENVTTRLTRETNEKLSEAALRQKLAKRKPDTRQDIVEQAVREWFTRSGFESS